MCGISGLFDTQGERDFDRALAAHINNIQAHRGPDEDDLHFEPGLALGLILVACCPGGTASNVICYLAKANVALSVLMTMCSTFIAIGLTRTLDQLDQFLINPFAPGNQQRSLFPGFWRAILGGRVERDMRVDFRRINAAHQRSSLVDPAQLVFVKIPTGADVVRGESDRHMGVCRAAANER